MRHTTKNISYLGLAKFFRVLLVFSPPPSPPPPTQSPAVSVHSVQCVHDQTGKKNYIKEEKRWKLWTSGCIFYSTDYKRKELT